jgi:hypothetical protein
MTIIFIVIGITIVLSLGLFFYEIKNAKEVDPKETFIYGDYDPLKDPNNNVIVHEC